MVPVTVMMVMACAHVLSIARTTSHQQAMTYHLMAI